MNAGNGQDQRCLLVCPLKGRGYCRAKINENGILQLIDEAAGYLGLEIGNELTDNIAFTMGAKGPLINAIRVRRPILMGKREENISLTSIESRADAKLNL